MSKITFNNSHQQFYQSLKKSVEAYFQTRHLKKTGNWKLYCKAIVLIPAAIALYVILLSVHLPVLISLLFCVLLGIAIACIGFNVMHDANHGSYSNRQWINKTLGLSLNAIGGTAFFWKQKHNVLHHTYTNIEGADDDIAQSKLLRQSPTQPWKPIHKYQHIYMTLAYSLMLFMWVSVKDFKKYFTKMIHNTPLQPMNLQEHITFWASKILYLFFYIILPVIIVGPLAWLIGYVILCMTTSILIAYVFQLAHAVEGPAFDSVGIEDKMIETEWAIHQVKTTANFSPHSKFVSWWVGGLNFQIEHHLFPRISHVHYPAISQIVRMHCAKFALPYHSFPNVLSAVASHIRTMKNLGRKSPGKRNTVFPGKRT